MDTIPLRMLAAVAAFTVSVMWVACTPYAKPTLDEARSAYASDVMLSIRVIEDETGMPIHLVWVGAFLDSGEVPAAQGQSSRDGQLQLRVPRDGVELRTRRLGYEPQQRRLPAAERGVDTIPLEVRLVRHAILLGRDPANAAWDPQLRNPTAVTPCRPLDGRGARVARHVSAMILSDGVADVGLVDLRLAPVGHVVDRLRCRAAINAIARHDKRSHDGMQVHLFRLGYQGWAAHEPAMSGYVTIIYILDWSLMRVRRVVAFD